MIGSCLLATKPFDTSTTILKEWNKKFFNTLISSALFNWSDPELLANQQVIKTLTYFNGFKLLTLFDAQQLGEEQENDEKLEEILPTLDHPQELCKLTLGSAHAVFYSDIYEDVICFASLSL